MKKLLLFSIALLVAASSFSQQNNPAPALSKQDYLKKSKHQKTAAWALLGGGGTFIVTGIIITKGELIHENFIGQKSYKNDRIKGDFVLSGTLAMLGSIPLFIAASRNKKKAMSMSFKNQMLPQLQSTGFKYQNIPSLNLKISL